jgi:sulfite exporter TauE/SafE
MMFFGLGTVLTLMFLQALIRHFIQSGGGLWLRRLSASFIFLLGLWVLVAP